MLAWSIQRWIVAAATTPEVDPHGHVARVTRAHRMDPILTGSRTHYRHNAFGSLVEYPDLTGIQQDVELEVYGPRINVHDHTEQRLTPPDGSVCTICLAEFGSDVHESSCRQLLVCLHLFHWECFDHLLNGSYTGRILCPNCRMFICEPRPGRLKEY